MDITTNKTTIRERTKVGCYNFVTTTLAIRRHLCFSEGFFRRERGLIGEVGFVHKVK